MARYCEINLNVIKMVTNNEASATIRPSSFEKFEKCDLPHAHMLFHRADNYDTFVSAELSDLIEQLRLYQTVISVMIHGPYGPFNNNEDVIMLRTAFTVRPSSLVWHAKQDKSVHIFYPVRGEG
ncbi:hypothetical protein Glove_320g48 [Diversispora epigaea]|uniref:Uncharacterized protein n=1 Tax=Diversispora epigaea TaxID=1348612 RepID=A0A397HNP4_9GLOM|nr:hypothetical protein Glove_320g48 [Diversispora epigaea]